MSTSPRSAARRSSVPPSSAELRTGELVALLKGLLVALQAADGASRDVLVAVVTDGLRAPVR